MTPTARKAAEFASAYLRLQDGVTVPPEEVFSKSKRANVVRAKHIGWAWMRRFRREDGRPRYSYSEIARMARLSGDQPYDHASIIYGVREARRLWPGHFEPPREPAALKPIGQVAERVLKRLEAGHAAS